MDEDKPFVLKVIDTLVDNYNTNIEKDRESLQEGNSFVPFGSLTPFIPDPLKRLAYNRLKETASPESLDALETYKESLLGQIDKGIQKGSFDLTAAALSLPAYVADISTELLEDKFGIGEATKYTDIVEQIVPKIEVDSTVGEIAALATQFGIPSSAALKIANGLFQSRKLSNLPGYVDKAKELAKRALVYGSAEAGATFLATDPERITTASETLGFIGPYDRELSGADRAKQAIGRRFVAAGEAGVLTGGITAAAPMFPALAKAVGTSAAYTGAKAFQYGQTALGTVVNPLADVLVGSGFKVMGKQYPSLFGTQVQSVAQKLGQVKFPKLPPFNEWRQYSTASGNQTQKTLAYVDQFILAPFRSEGSLYPITKQLMRLKDSAVSSDIRYLEKNLDDMGVYMDDIADKMRTGFFNKLSPESSALLEQKNKTIYEFFAGLKPVTALDADIRQSAINIKGRLKKLNKSFADVLEDRSIAKAFADDGYNYLKQNYLALNNSAFIPDVELKNKAIESVKKLILTGKLSDLRSDIIKQYGATKATTKDSKFMAGLQNEAEKLITDILTTAKGNFYGKTLTPDEILNRIAKLVGVEESNLIAREQIPQAIKNLLGKSYDYRNAVLDTALQSAKGTYNKSLGDALYEEGLKSGWLYASRPAGRISGDILGTELQKISIKEPSFTDRGKIFTEGVFAAKPIAQAIMEMDSKLTSGFNIPLYKQLMAGKTSAQYAKTILSPTTQIRNVSSGPMMILNTGMYGSKANILDSLKIISQDLFPTGTSSKEFLNYIEDAVNRGILDENVITSELRYLFNATKSRDMTVDGLMKLVTESKFGQKATSFYQAGDNLWKIWLDKSYQDMLTQVFDYKKIFKNGKVIDESINMKNVKDWFKNIAQIDFLETSFKTGATKTPGDILREASAHYVTNVLPTYSKVPPFIETIRKLPIGNFVAFPAEILRTSAINLQFATRELASNNAVLRQNGLRRILGTMATNYGLYAGLSSGLSALTGVSKDMIEAYRRSFAAPYQKNAQLLPFSGLDDDGSGNFKINDFSFYNPYSYNTAGLRALINNYTQGKINQQNASDIVMNMFFGDPYSKTPGILEEYLNPYFGESISTQRISDVTLRGGLSKEGKRIYYPTDSGLEKINKGFAHVFSGLEPGFLTTARRVYKGVTEDFTEYGSGYNSTQEIVKAFTGVNVQDTKPFESMPFILSSYQKDNENIASKYNKMVLDPSKEPRDRVEAAKQWLLDSLKSQKKLRTVLNDAEILKMDESDLNDMIEERLRSSASPILENQFKTPTISEKRIENLLKTMERTSETIFKHPLKQAKEEMIQNSNNVIEQMFNEVEGFDLSQPDSEFEKLLNDVIRGERRELKPIKEKPFFRKESFAPSLGTQVAKANTPISPPVNPQVVQVSNPLAGVLTPSGLTRTETALLSPTEQLIRLGQRQTGQV